MKQIFSYLFIYLSFTTFSQELSVDWGVCFGDSGNYSISDCIEVLPNNNIITAVIVTSNNEAYTNFHGSSDPWVLILDKSGNILQERCFGGSDAEYFGDIEVTSEYIYFIGQTHSTDGDVQSEPIGGYGNLWVVKTDLDLNIIWERQYGCLGTQDFETAKITPEGGLILLMDFFNQGGGDVSEYFGETDIWVCEIDANGDIIWEKTLGNSYENYARNDLINSNNNIIVAGATVSSGGMIQCTSYGGMDYWAAEIDRDINDIIWQGCYGGSNNETSIDIIEDFPGYIITGVTLSVDGNISFNHGGLEAWLIKIGVDGQLLWDRCFGSNI